MSDNACLANNGNDCAEANLDLQYLMAVSRYSPTTFYYWGGKDFLLDWIRRVGQMAAPPLVFSISYGMSERDLPPSYGASFDIEAMKLGLRGVTILAASGDDGAVSQDARKNAIKCAYSPQFPASSAYVTSVGGTMVLLLTIDSLTDLFFNCNHSGFRDLKTTKLKRFARATKEV
jgi:tripeptidyl-peptidase-1